MQLTNTRLLLLFDSVALARNLALVLVLLAESPVKPGTRVFPYPIGPGRYS